MGVTAFYYNKNQLVINNLPSMCFVRKIDSMRYLIRIVLILVLITLGWINLPAQAYLLPDNQNLWPVLSEHFSIATDDLDQTNTRQQLDWDLQNPAYIHQLTKNARPYLYYI